MSIPDHNNNGTANPIVREWNDTRASRRATLPTPTYTPSATSYFRHWSIVAAVGLIVILFLVLFGVVPGVGAAERPKAEAVEIAKVTGDAGWYVVKLSDGRIFQVIPPRSRARVTPAPQVGAATLTSTTLIQGGYSYARVKR